MMKKTNKRYSKEEQRVIIEAIQKTPFNLNHAFDEVAKQLRGRTKGSISGHYYSTLRPLMNREGIIVTELTTTHGSIMNAKTIARKESQQYLVVKQLTSRLSGEERARLISELFDEM